MSVSAALSKSKSVERSRPPASKASFLYSEPAGFHSVARNTLSLPPRCISVSPLLTTKAQLPARLGDDHLRAQLVEFVPELLGLQAAGDFSHFLTGDNRGGGDQRLRAQRGGRWTAAPTTKFPVSIQAGQLAQGLSAG